MGFNVTGIEGVLLNIKIIKKAIEQEVRKEVLDSCDDLLQKSLLETPLDSGALRASSKSQIISKASSIIVGQVSFNTVYALIQHEVLWYNHPVVGTKAKYLEDPMKANEQEYIKKIANGVRKGVNK